MSTQRRVGQNQEARSFGDLDETGFFWTKKPFGHCDFGDFISDFAGYSQRLPSAELLGAGTSTSVGGRAKEMLNQFRCVATGQTASSLPFSYGRSDLATNSLGFGSCCDWHFCHGLNGSRNADVFYMRRSSTSGSSPARIESRAGYLPEQLPLISPLLSGASGLEDKSSARIAQSALPQAPTGSCPGAERQYGQGNLYFKHAARNTACNFRR